MNKTANNGRSDVYIEKSCYDLKLKLRLHLGKDLRRS